MNIIKMSNFRSLMKFPEKIGKRVTNSTVIMNERTVRNSNLITIKV